MSNKIDFDFKKEVAAVPGGENLLNCYLCGCCTASCPAASIEATFSPRKIMRMTLNGQKDELLRGEMIWLCLQCNTCSARCPQNAHPAEVIQALRKMAQTQGYRHEKLSELIDEADREGMRQFISGVKSLLRSTEEAK